MERAPWEHQLPPGSLGAEPGRPAPAPWADKWRAVFRDGGAAGMDKRTVPVGTNLATKEVRCPPVVGMNHGEAGSVSDRRGRVWLYARQTVWIYPLSRGLTDLLCKGPESKYFRLCGPYSLPCNFSALPPQRESGVGGYVNERACLCSSKLYL